MSVKVYVMFFVNSKRLSIDDIAIKKPTQEINVHIHEYQTENSLSTIQYNLKIKPTQEINFLLNIYTKFTIYNKLSDDKV